MTKIICTNALHAACLAAALEYEHGHAYTLDARTVVTSAPKAVAMSIASAYSVKVR